MALPLVLLLWLRVMSTGAVTRVTNLTFVNQTLTWNDAQEACRSIGGHLVQILDETKNNVVSHAMEGYSSNFGVQGSLSLDLARSSPGNGVFYWISSCDLLAWSRWSDGESNNSTQQCVSLSWESATWNTGACDSPRVYMCEHNTDIECPFEEIGETRLWEDGSLIIRRTYLLSLETCFSRCSTWRTGDGTECWAVNYKPDSEMCKIFFTLHPYLVTNSSYLTSAASWTLYVRRCYNVFEGGPFNLTSSPSVAPQPLFPCEERNDSSTVDTTTTPNFASTFSETSDPFTAWTTKHVSSTKTSALSTISPTLDFQSAEISLSTPISSYGSTDTGFSGGNNGQKQTTTVDVNSSVSTHWSMSVEQTRSYAARPTKSMRTACLCPCHISLSVSAKKMMVRELLTNLTVNKTQLSSYRRKHFSVPDDRPLSVGIGWAGIACVAICLGVIIVCDATTFGRRHLESLKLNTRCKRSVFK